MINKGDRLPSLGQGTYPLASLSPHSPTGGDTHDPICGQA
jgi:hypothetical protein